MWDEDIGNKRRKLPEWFNHPRIRAETRTKPQTNKRSHGYPDSPNLLSNTGSHSPDLQKTYCHRRAAIAKKAAPNAAITGTKALRFTSEDAEVAPPLPDDELPDADAADPVTLDPVADGAVEGADPVVGPSVTALSMVRPDW